MINILQRNKVDHSSGAAGLETLDEEGETGSEEEHYQDDQEENTESLLTPAVIIKNKYEILYENPRYLGGFSSMASSDK